MFGMPNLEFSIFGRPKFKFLVFDRNYPGTKFFTSDVQVKKENNNEKLPFCTHVLSITSNLVFSRCCFVEDGKEMYPTSVQRTCRAP